MNHLNENKLVETNKSPQKVLFTGLTDMSFFRNKSISNSLIKGNFTVNQVCTKSPTKKRSEITFSAVLKWFLFVLLSLLGLVFNPKKVKGILTSDICYFGYPSNLCFVEMAIMKYIFRKKVVFDPFIFLSDTIVDDRAYTSSKGVKKLLYLIDTLGARASTLVLSDCSGHSNYIRENFRAESVILHVGANDELFFPSAGNSETNDDLVLKLYTHSTFIPLHGVECLVEAMRLLDNQKFHLKIAGMGQRFDEVQQKVNMYNLTNVELLGMVPQKDLRSEIVASDLCLGIFGLSEKSKRVIPQKFFEFIACAKPVLTQSSESYDSDLTSAFYCSNDFEQVAETLEEIYRIRHELRERGQKLHGAYCARYGLHGRDFEIQKLFAGAN